MIRVIKIKKPNTKRLSFDEQLKKQPGYMILNKEYRYETENDFYIIPKGSIVKIVDIEKRKDLIDGSTVGYRFDVKDGNGTKATIIVANLEFPKPDLLSKKELSLLFSANNKQKYDKYIPKYENKILTFFQIVFTLSVIILVLLLIIGGYLALLNYTASDSFHNVLIINALLCVITLPSQIIKNHYKKLLPPHYMFYKNYQQNMSELFSLLKEQEV